MKKSKPAIPTNSTPKINLYVAEDIRAETNGKMTCIGLFPDDTLVLQLPEEELAIFNSGKSPTGYALDRVAIAINIGGIDGTFNSFIQMFTPSGKKHTEKIALPPFTLPKGGSQTLMLGSSTFPVAEAGTYRIQLDLNDMSFDVPFEIRVALLPPIP